MDKEKLLDKFETYITEDLGYLYNTHKGYRSSIKNYLDWLSDNEVEPKKVSLSHTYDFLAYRRLKGDKHRTIIGYKTAITHFNQCIGMKQNPALLVYLAKSDKKTPIGIIDEESLEAIYREIQANTLIQKRDRCMLGMMVFLGLQRTELAILELDDLDLEQGRVYIPATQSTNERFINLHPKQMMHLSQYIYDIRRRLLQEYKLTSNRLFFSCGEAPDLNGALARMMKRIKLEFHYVRDFKQLKQSRMVIWVKEHGLRQAQYLGGYRYVTSVQRYDFKSIDGLQRKLTYSHPMEQMN
ncbi:hypothetical protein Q763_17590 [Flavobacterium beibuense F44-8]|uniref:Integrase n=1 Tax=Flavobacterium beibuense F44-8 TaxID=1406840 RepID=A0A0A2LQT8_9FLAO|nr:tyrosine-type recombinase/integrase [Flavobacterium beibuense]KGO78600.1 hypothetical protein Q763_17590 [Flavobacterium beibuense F44-8]